jgi:WD40 repeat protein
MLAEGDSLTFVFGLRNTELISIIKTGGVSSLTFSPDELRAAFLDEQHSGLVYSLEEQRVIDTLRSLAFAGPSSFSPDGRKLVGSAFNQQSGKQDPLVWELSNSGADLSADLPPHGEGPTLFANVAGLETEFSPDGAYLLTMGHESEEVRLFGAKKETEGYMEKIFELQHSESVQVAHFTPDGSRVITQSEDGQVHVWPLFDSAQALIDTARAHATRQLTAKQRERFNISVEK